MHVLGTLEVEFGGVTVYVWYLRLCGVLVVRSTRTAKYFVFFLFSFLWSNIRYKKCGEPQSSQRPQRSTTMHDRATIQDNTTMHDKPMLSTIYTMQTAEASVGEIRSACFAKSIYQLVVDCAET